MGFWQIVVTFLEKVGLVERDPYYKPKPQLPKKNKKPTPRPQLLKKTPKPTPKPLGNKPAVPQITPPAKTPTTATKPKSESETKKEDPKPRYNDKLPTMPTGNKIARLPRYLHPALRKPLELALEECHTNGLVVYVFESYRTPERQQYLYEQGRTRDGNIVTNAKPYFSWHQYGLAFDLVFDGDSRDGIQWSWEGDYNTEQLYGDKRDDYTRVGAILERYGFEWAARWKTCKETPHCQKTFGLKIGEAKSIRDSHGLQGIWAEVTRRHLNQLTT